MSVPSQFVASNGPYRRTAYPEYLASFILKERYKQFWWALVAFIAETARLKGDRILTQLTQNKSFDTLAKARLLGSNSAQQHRSSS
jgi:hypothetical protein